MSVGGIDIKLQQHPDLHEARRKLRPVSTDFIRKRWNISNIIQLKRKFQQLLQKFYNCDADLKVAAASRYSRTSVARTLMARLPRLFPIRS